MILFGILALTLATGIPGATPDATPTSPFIPMAFEAPSQQPPPVKLLWTGTPQTRGGWQDLIDATWGPGDPDQVKLDLFNRFWLDIDYNFACFNGIEDHWDDLRARYLDEITAGGVSAGRFSGILGQLSLSLRESHTKAFDLNVLNTTQQHGTPILIASAFGNRGTTLGASVTGQPDGTGLVYRVHADNPLGLEPGDVILGYDGRPWLELRDELLEAELPVSGMWGSSPQSWNDIWAGAVGANWHLFDTMDVVKFSTGELVHLDTHQVDGYFNWLYGSEQMPVGIPFPNTSVDEYVTWGTVDHAGQEVGYIYVFAWTGDVDEMFDTAITDLLENHDTAGLIIDFRFNMGGNMFLSSDGLSKLFTEDTPTIDWYVRGNNDNHLAMAHMNIWPNYTIPSDPEYGYLNPIAVLTGPAAVSSGDQVAYRMTYHPTARIFGRSTAAAFNAPEFTLDDHYYLINATAECGPYDELYTYLTHQDFPVDEDCWLTPEDVAEGRDTVVESALNWIFGTVNIEDTGRPETPEELPAVSQLVGAYPNPFNPSTRLVIALAEPGAGELAVFDLTGRRVRTFDLSGLSAGEHHLSWDGRSDAGRVLASGSYLVQLRTEGRVEGRRVTLVK